MNSARAVASAVWLRDWRAVLLIVAVGFAVLAPEFVTGPSTSDSLRFNIVWLDQWRELVAGGDLYPRWMPRSWDGLGSPAFTFYPPLLFYLAVGLDQVTFRALDTGSLLSLTSAVLLGASGLSMRRWLRPHVGAGAALLGGLAYMLAPYHLYDILARAALAETCAYAVLPLVMLSMKRLAEGHDRAVPALAVAYAALVLSHLPVALLTSVVLLPAYAFILTTRPATLARLAGGGVLGLGLAAIYLLPALVSTDTILAEALSTRFFLPDNWFLWRPDVLAEPIMWVVVPACSSALLLALAVVFGTRGRGDRTGVLVWAGFSFAIVLLIAGIPPAFWHLPNIALVQFPWRLMVVLEFVAVTGVALAAPGLFKPLTMLAVLPLAGSFTAMMLMVAQRLDASRSHSPEDIASIRESYRDAPEYLPAGFRLNVGPDGIPNPMLVQLPRGPVLQVDGPASARVRLLPAGEMMVIVNSPAPTMVVARRFSHGPWTVTNADRQAVRTGSTSDHLVSWQAPAGRSLFQLRLGTRSEEILGRVISSLALMMILLLLIRAKRTRQHREASLIAAQ